MEPLHYPIYLTAVFKQIGDAYLTERGTELKYSREENPTVRNLEDKLAKLENAENALAFNSGMGAISTLFLSLLKAGDEIVMSMEGYGTTIEVPKLLEKFGVRVRLAYPSAEKICETITSNTTLVFIETMTNPTLKVIDVREVAKKCREEEITLIVDNTFVTPILYRPLEDGVNFVVHSLTKYIAGHNDVTGGVILWNGKFLNDLWDWRRRLGTIIQPFDAWMVERGMRTLNVRFEKQSKNALAIAEFLQDHPKVRKVHYPGLPSDPYHGIARRLFRKDLYGGVVSFDLGSEKSALAFLRSLKKIFPSPSLGGVESLATYPVKSAVKNMEKETRDLLGITDGLIRLSVGIEEVDELIEDLDRALKGC
ncbi:cystathionine gamma-synthase [Pyrococcus furiosus DSM 3638]|uniref:Cystathionine gamma-lyase (Gamma-cystathionase) n=3 Tax=Pyrococcus furiosus TaxID=2261 RepID=Q8U1E2_PYRFU|nr:cystathionine gamma-synthase family protein [Pyrococcus furiosus]AAL81390.1 cystathionine gamma-lyase (gamma-cystathionase) [Pyrococcus furiosus DSM 3638]AFN04050.1 cystathionine gamma-synthase [Pyrococcus furiosus COM1]QEK78908.1 cystathionine gamma-synthase [Pyrococcus furiosus DSM 3638]